ncbi:MAG: hypothetical protein JOZ70_11715 [Pseudolabrys sp.]|nr:hypothetical protein [Pseudolabrys sp.]MBV9955903.1 hypothetical protein [Pseudolabrys sp.]
MQCPYCAETIKDDAIACKHCNRDFFIIQPLMTKLKAANKRVTQLEKKLKAAGIDPDGENRPSSVSAAATMSMAQQTAAVAGAINRGIPTMPVYGAVIATILILIAAHYLIIIQLDLPLVYLRVVSIAVPFIFGFFNRKALDRWLGWDLLTGVMVALVSILVMSIVVARVDKVPILPTDAQGWLEYAQYAASIAFGFFAGCVVRHGITVASAPSERASFLIELISRFIASKLKKDGDGDGDDKPGDSVDAAVKKIQGLVSGAIAVGSIAVSAYTGLSGILGK